MASLRKRQKGDTWELIVSGFEVQPMVLGSMVTETAGMTQPGRGSLSALGSRPSQSIVREMPSIAQWLGQRKEIP